MNLIYLLLFLSVFSLSAMEHIENKLMQLTVQDQQEQLIDQNSSEDKKDYYQLLKKIVLMSYIGPIKYCLGSKLIPHSFIEQLLSEALVETSECITMPKNIFSISPNDRYFFTRDSVSSGWGEARYTLYVMTDHRSPLCQIVSKRNNLLEYIWNDNDHILQYQDCLYYDTSNEWVTFNMQTKKELSRRKNPLLYDSLDAMSPDNNYILLFTGGKTLNNIITTTRRKRELFKLLCTDKEIQVPSDSLFTLPKTEWMLCDEHYRTCKVYWSFDEHYFFILDVDNDCVSIYDINNGICVWNYEIKHAYVSDVRWSDDSHYVVYHDMASNSLVLIDVAQQIHTTLIKENKDNRICAIHWYGDFVKYQTKQNIKIITKKGQVIAEKKIRGTVYSEDIKGFGVKSFGDAAEYIYERFDSKSFIEIYNLLFGKQPAYQQLFLQLLSIAGKIELNDQNAYPWRFAWKRLCGNELMKKILSRYVEWSEKESGT